MVKNNLGLHEFFSHQMLCVVEPPELQKWQIPLLQTEGSQQSAQGET